MGLYCKRNHHIRSVVHTRFRCEGKALLLEAQRSWLIQRLADIKAYRAPSLPSKVTVEFTPDRVRTLSVGLREPRATIIRGLLSSLGCREDVPFRWNLEHKLLQYYVFVDTIADAMPATIGVGALRILGSPQKIHKHLLELWPQGYVMKTTLGYGSRRSDVTASGTCEALATAIDDSPPECRCSLIDERYMVQRKVTTVYEYRVHSIGRRVIPSLTLRTWGGPEHIATFEKSLVVDQTSQWIAALPDALVGQTLCGWDIGRDHDGHYHVFDLNLSGHHLLYEPAFHCSAALGRDWLAEVHLAYLIRDIKRHCDFTVTHRFEPTAEGVDKLIKDMLYRIEMWSRLLDVSHAVRTLVQESYRSTENGCGPIRRTAYSKDPVYSDAKFIEIIDGCMRQLNELSD